MSAWEITRKDLKLLWRDKRTAFILIALPMIFITVIGLTFGQLLGWKNENQLYRIAVVDNVDYERYYPPDEEIEGRPQLAKAPMNRTWAHNIVTELIDRMQDHQGIMVKPASNQRQADRMIEDGDANAALIIGPDFVDRVMSLEPEDLTPPAEGEEARIRSLADLDMQMISEDPTSTTHTILEVLVGDATQKTLLPYILCSVESQTFTAAGRIAQLCSSVREEADAPPADREFIEKVPQASRQDIYRVLVPGYTVLFVFFLVNIMGYSFIHERDLGTLRRLRVAPVRNASLLLGKTIPFLMISLMQTAILFLFGKVLFDMSWGAEPWLLIPIIFCTSMAATALGLLVATMVRTESQVSAYANFIVLLAGAISGCLMPREWLPEPMQKISLGTPHAWALEAYAEALRDNTPEMQAIFESCGVLVGFSLLFFALGAWRFGKVE